MGYWPVVNHLIDEADIIVIIGDARMPIESLNSEAVDKIERRGKEYIVAYNKMDLVSDKTLRTLRERYTDAFFVSGVKNLGINKLRKHLQIMGKRMRLESPKIAIVGYPNIGKSAVINALARGARTLVADIPGTTKGVQWVNVSNLKILDSPGVIPFGDRNIKLGMLGAKSPDKMDSPDKVAREIINLIIGNDKKILEEHYRIKVESVEEDADEIIQKIGIARKYLKKGGIVDEHRVVVSVIREWQKGKLGVG